MKQNGQLRHSQKSKQTALGKVSNRKYRGELWCWDYSMILDSELDKWLLQSCRWELQSKNILFCKKKFKEKDLTEVTRQVNYWWWETEISWSRQQVCSNPCILRDQCNSQWSISRKGTFRYTWHSWEPQGPAESRLSSQYYYKFICVQKT